MKAIYELDRGECRWPTVCNEDKGQLFCAAESVQGRSYCREHGRMSVASGIYDPIEPTGEVVMPKRRREYLDRTFRFIGIAEHEPDLTKLIEKGDAAYGESNFKYRLANGRRSAP